MFEKEFAAVGIDTGRVVWRNLFQRCEGQAGIEQDYDKLFREDSVNCTAWEEKIAEILAEPVPVSFIDWCPALEIIMEA